MFDINDQVTVVKNWWAEIEPKDQSSKKLLFVCRKLVEKKIFIDPSSAQNYIQKMSGNKTNNIEFNDFLLVFLRGIVKDVVTGIAQTVKDFKRSAKDLSSDIFNMKADIKKISDGQKKEERDTQSEKTLLWKLSEYKREQLIALLQKGIVKKGQR